MSYTTATSVPLVRPRWRVIYTTLDGVYHASIPFDDKALAERLNEELRANSLILRSRVSLDVDLKPLGAGREAG